MIDWYRVRELHAEIGEEAFEEVLALFVEEVDEALARLRDAAHAPARMAEFHFLKGAALNLGLQDMASLCGKAEQMASEAIPTDTECQTILAEFPKTIALLRDDWRSQV